MPIPDGVAKMKDGTYIFKNGEATKVKGDDRPVDLGPTTVEPSGAVTFADGKDMKKLQEGQMVTFGGKILKAPSEHSDQRQPDE